jgi:hypothetical protein
MHPVERMLLGEAMSNAKAQSSNNVSANLTFELDLTFGFWNLNFLFGV